MENNMNNITTVLESQKMVLDAIDPNWTDDLGERKDDGELTPEEQAEIAEFRRDEIAHDHAFGERV